MRLKKLELVNVCQHEHLVLNFAAGLIGIYGPNGSGKTNAMMSCYAGFTNDYSRHQLGKAGMIRQQAGTDEQSSIETWFEQDGHDYSIYRGLQRPEKHLMRRPGDEKDLKKANEIAVELEDVLGIKRRLIDDYIFVPQWDLFAFLSKTDTERAKSFAHLCNTTHAEHIWQLLGDQITADAPLASQVVDNSDEIRKQIGDYKTRLKPLQDRLAEHRQHMLDDTRAAELQQIVDKHNRHAAIAEELPELEEAEQTKKRAAIAAKKAYDTADAALVPLRTQLGELEAARDDAKAKFNAHKPEEQKAQRRLTEVGELAKRLKRKREVVVKIETAQAELAALEAPPQPNPDVLADLRQQLRAKEKQVEAAQHLVAGCGGDAIACPTCGTPTDQLQDKIEEASQMLPTLTEELETVEAAVAECEALVEPWNAYQRSVAAKEANIQALTTELGGYENDKPVKKGTTASLKEVIDKHAELEQAFDQAQEAVDANKETLEAKQTSIRELETKKERAIATHQAAKKSLKQKRGQLAENEVNEEDFVAANSELAQHKEAEVKVASHEARIEALEGFVDEKREELAKVKKQLARSARARRWVQILTDVRDEVMHRDRLPRVVHQNYLLDMVDSVNDTLADFNAPFHVTATEDVGFTAHFSNGTVMPAPGLSGGQKVVLALAFRLTVNSIFAPQLGTMVLDEPTDGLDRDNRQLAAEFFRELGTVARSRGLQVIVITHDDELERIFDQKVVLERAA